MVQKNVYPSNLHRVGELPAKIYVVWPDQSDLPALEEYLSHEGSYSIQAKIVFNLVYKILRSSVELV